MPLMEPVPYALMRDRVTVQERAASQGTTGEAVLSWSDVATVRALVETVGGSEAVYAGRVVADASHRVTLRYYPGLTTKHRLLLLPDGRTLNVLHVEDTDNRHRQHVLLCKEVV